MKIVKKNGQIQDLSFDKITNRMLKSAKELSNTVDIDLQLITQKVVNRLIDMVSTYDIDQMIIQTLSEQFANDTFYQDLALNIFISRLHKSTPKKFSIAFKKLFDTGIVFQKYYDFVKKNAKELDNMIIKDNDYKYSYFGIKTMERLYLYKQIETPQYLLMRVSIQLYYNTENALENIKNCYLKMSHFLYTPATPILKNSCTKTANLASCYLFYVGDSIKNIYKTLTNQAICSKVAGGLGMSASDIRSNNMPINNVGYSKGLISMLSIFNASTNYVNQQGVRQGSLAVYLEPWHPEILDFIEIRTIGGDESKKCRKLFPALWMPDEFYKRLKLKQDWYLMDPKICPGLSDVYGEEFNTLYQSFIDQGKYVKKLKFYENEETQTDGEFQKLFQRIVAVRCETGTPYILHKDIVNEKSNQKHIGIIKNSNLCAEICLVSNENEIGVCNLSSISLKNHLDKHNEMDWKYLGETARQLVRNINQAIDNTEYIREDGDNLLPKETKQCNTQHRPIGIGIQGLADVFAIKKIPWETDKAKLLNENIMRTIYYYAMLESCELAKEKGSYPTFKNSPLSRGIFQFDFEQEREINDDKFFIKNQEFDELKEQVKQYGARNSMITALMPTASSSQILGNNECFDPFHSNLYTRQTLVGNVTLLNKYLVKDLKELNMWNEQMKKDIIRFNGSIQEIYKIPKNIRDVYKTCYEIPNKLLMDFAKDRQSYVSHSQSMNLYYSFKGEMNTNDVAKDMIYAWKIGLKTACYYTHSREAVRNYDITNVCYSKENCESCSS